MYFVEESKSSVIETDSDLQRLALFCWAKKRFTVEIFVRMTELSAFLNISSDKAVA